MSSFPAFKTISRRRRQWKDRALIALCACSALLCVGVLGWLLVSIFLQGHEYLSLDFLRNAPSRKPEKAGIYPAMVGSIWICSVCAAAAIPLGVGTAILLEEFKPRRAWLVRVRTFVQMNIANLAGVPSVVYGLLGLTAFVHMFNLLDNAGASAWSIGDELAWYHLSLPFGRGVLATGLTLMLVVLPIVIIATQEALRSVPQSLRQAALGLGATRWQTIWHIALPAAVPQMMTGVILAMSRAMGEAAPILVVAGIVYITFTPSNLMDDATAMPLQIFDWAGRPQEEFHRVAAAGILVLLGVLLCFNAVAIFIRQRSQKLHG